MLSVTFRIDFKVLLLVYKSLNGRRPRYIAYLITKYKSNCPQIIRIKSVEIARVNFKQDLQKRSDVLKRSLHLHTYIYIYTQCSA